MQLINQRRFISLLSLIAIIFFCILSDSSIGKNVRDRVNSDNSMPHLAHSALQEPSFDENSNQVSSKNKIKKSDNVVFDLDRINEFSVENYETLNNFERKTLQINGHNSAQYSRATRENYLEPSSKQGLENATFFSLVRNSDIYGILKSIESVEERFNKYYHYDWVFANDEPFDPLFIKLITNAASGNPHFVVIPEEFWGYPSWIDLGKAEETRKSMKKNKVKYGDSESYRHMCRFNSGFFYRLPIMLQYRYYWRVEPDIEFRCDIFEQDWFKYMRENNKKYAFTLAPLELHTTVKNLWKTAMEFKNLHPEYVADNNNLDFLSEDGGHTYNMCHFWSNFEIGDLEFFRSESYSKYFEFIDKEGGFYYSRWGDAPVHSIGVSMLLSNDSLLFLQNTGYYHSPNGDCPHDRDLRERNRCTCFANKDATWSRKNSCIPKWFEIHNIEKPPSVPKFKYEHKHKVTKEELEEDELFFSSEGNENDLVD